MRRGRAAQRRARWRARRRPALAVLGLCLLACAAEPGAWEGGSLWRFAPALEAPATKRRGLLRRVTVPYGPASLAPAGEAGQESPTAAPKPGLVEALEHPAGSRVAIAIQPGRDAHLSFVPLPGCSCARRLRLRTAEGEERELWSETAAPAAWPPPATVEIPLSPSAQAVTLLLEASAGEGRARWGSPAVWWRTESPAPLTAAGPPNIVLLAADTLRADALGAYGRRPSVTPALDALAEESEVWLRAYSTFNVTNPSFASILTGWYGRRHGVTTNRSRASDRLVTLGEVLSARGYATGAFLGASHLRAANLAQGFAHVQAPPSHAAAELVIGRSLDWLQEAPEPFFAWLHLYDPHTPHTPPLPFAEGRRSRQAYGLGPVRAWSPWRETGLPTIADPQGFGHADLYLGEVAYLDRQVDRLLGFLRSRGLLERSLVVFLADHGENLGEHGLEFRHLGLWETTTHVPLLIHWPGGERRGRRHQELVQTIDLFPTLLAAAGAPAPPHDGRDLLASPPRRVVFAEHSGGSGEMVRSPDHRLFRLRRQWLVAAGDYLFDLRRDPQERVNLAGQAEEVQARLADELERWRASGDEAAPPAEPLVLDAEAARELEALGYVD